MRSRETSPTTEAARGPRSAPVIASDAKQSRAAALRKAWRFSGSLRVARDDGTVLLRIAAAIPLLGALGLWIYAASLPPLDLTAAKARSVVVLDRAGDLLRPFATRDGRWRLPVTAASVDSRYLAILKAYEDRRFDQHLGVDPQAVIRAAFQGLRHGRIVSGGSTLSMQVARLVEPRARRSGEAKLRQAIRAVSLERWLGKAQVLDLYLALAPFGGSLEGVRAASLAYFGREPTRLTVGQAALLVALPQSPETRRPDRFPERARVARDRVIAIARHRGIIGEDEARAARAEPIPTARRPFPMLAAHAAEEAVAAQPGTPEIRLTLDGRLQASLEALTAERVGAAGPALSAAIVVLDNRDGSLVARVGSAGYLDTARKGAIDMTRAIRSPGSALKPFVYAMAFDAGLAHPETFIEDRPSRFSASYAPENFDQTFQGTVTARRALQLSLNVPAVALMEAVGPARFVAHLRRAGADLRLPREAAPGLPVALGGIGLSLMDLGRLYAGIARGGEMAPPFGGRRIAGDVAAWYIADILRGTPPPDNALSNRIAYKTGTSFGYRDAWSAGFDRRATIAVWVGRPDGAAVPGLVGRLVAAPILFDAFARFGGEPVAGPRPADALVVSNAALPPPLRRLSHDEPVEGTATLRIAYPPDGARVDLGLAAGTTQAMKDAVILKASGGVPPLTWMVDGIPVERSIRRQTSWIPDGAGYARISVLDATGASDSVSVRIE